MTVDVQTPRAVYLYSQNVDYPVTFSYLEKEDVRVTVVDENSKETRLQQGVDWEFSDSQEVHLLNEYTTTDSIVIFRQTTPDQETAWEADVRIEPTILEYDFDKLTLLVQELLDDKSTTVRMPLDFTGDEPVLDPELLNKVILAADEARLSAEEAEASAEAAAISETYANSSAANAEVDANRAEAAADRAESAADLSEQYANNAEQSEINAGQSEANAEAAVSLAEDAAGGATASATAALDSENRAYQWAQNPEDVPVRENPDSSENEYSAYHWAKKAEVGNVPTATEVDEGVVRFGTAAEHASGLNGVAAQPGRVREMLFANSGADAKLRTDILPVATSASLGGVKPDGTTVTVDSSGVISATVTPSALAAKLDTSVYNADAPKRILASGRINSNGSIAYGINIASCTVLGTGRRSITMAIAASSANYEVFATIDGGATLNLNNVINFCIDSATTFRIGIYAGSSVWADQSFNFIVVGN